ncbi:unnamed protein product [Rotaria socialis]
MQEAFRKNWNSAVILSANVERQKNAISSKCKICETPVQYSYCGAILRDAKQNKRNGKKVSGADSVSLKSTTSTILSKNHQPAKSRINQQ